MRLPNNLALRLFPEVIFYSWRRKCSSITPRVRFAPSPTGYLHLGGLRTALYNYLFAKSRGGILILRIEDTDQTRKVEGSVESLVKDLEWCGIHYDEGPNKPGNYGPYTQSERLNLYHEHIDKLLKNGSAYKCFCTERRLNIIKRDAIKSRAIPKYDNKCRSLSQEDVDKKISSGAQYCIRFKLTSDCLTFDDLVFGGIAYDVTQNEGDPVILKSDGYPTYHFANVVDDHLMKVTHVLRGVEWQISTTKHILLYRAFGWQPPMFGHLPLIVNADGTKLSKRQSDIRVSDYRDKGIFPLALTNFITLSGGGFDHVAGAGVRIKNMDELAKEFNIENVSSHPSRLNPDLLNECNRLEFTNQLEDPNKLSQLVTKLQTLITEKYPNEKLLITNQHIEIVLKWCRNRITRIEDLATDKFAFLWILPLNKTLNLEQKTLLNNLILDLEKVDFNEGSLKNSLKAFSKASSLKYPVLMKLLRSVLSGLNEGPSVAEMMDLLGREETLLRIKSVL